MGETIRMRVWVDVWSSSNQANPPMIWTNPPSWEITKGTRRYQINFEVPTFEPDLTGTVEGEVTELSDGNGVSP